MALKPGTRLGHYEITAAIGAGGMGEVYRARDEHLDRDVAVKVLPAGTLADEDARRRFRKEAKALSRLNHPNIQTVHDFDTQGGVDFLVTEYVPGVTLSDKLSAGVLAEKEVVRLGTQLIEGLVAAHDQGIVHRDLKPGNLRVTPDGRLKILDFGLAKLVRPVTETATTECVTETQAMAGTLPYMAPEQLRGERTDARSDLYAAGVVLYEMTTGQRPFQEELSTALADSILHQAPVTPRALNAKVSPHLERIILKCLEKEPENRYQSASEMKVDLRQLGTSLTAPAARAPAPGRTTGRRALTAAAIAGVALLAVLAGWNVGGWRDRLLGRASAGAIESLAVLPLQNLSGNPEHDYFADGMTEALISTLARIRALKVISRTSAMRFKGTEKSLPEIARALNVDAVVEGSVLLVGSQVRVTAQLIEAATDRHLWAESYVRNLRNVLDLHSEVATAIAREIEIAVTPEERARLSSPRPLNPEAYQLSLKGRFHLNKQTKEEIQKSIAYFEQALKSDPNYARAYAGLADAYKDLSSFYLPPREVMPRAKAAAIKALGIDPTLAGAHTSLAYINLVYEWDFLGAEKELQRALELNPNSGEAYGLYGLYLTAVNRHEEAMAAIKRALEIDPLSLTVHSRAEFSYYMARKYDRVIEQCLETIEIAPTFHWAYVALGLAYVQIGRLSEAVTAARTAARFDDSPVILAILANTYAIAGKEAEARKVLDELHEKAKKRYVCAYEVGLAHAGLGEIDRAFELLERAYQERADCLVWLRTDSRLDPLRSDPRFQDLLRRLNFPEQASH